MKKYLSAFCSIAASILIFVTLSIEWIIWCPRYLNPPYTNRFGETIFNGWDLLNVNATQRPSLYIISALLLIVLAVVLLVNATLIILKNLKVIKNDFNFNKVNAGLLTIFPCLSILATFGIGIIFERTNINIDFMPGPTIMLVVSILACVFGWIFSRQPKEKKEAIEQNNKTQNVVANQNPQTQNIVTEPTYSTQNNINTPNDNFNQNTFNE